MPRQIAGIGAALFATATACVVLAGSGTLRARDTITVERSHVRATDPRMEAAVAYGIERSPTFRWLVDAISRSDLIVYISTRASMIPPLDGEIHFVTSVGAYRYMRILIRGELSPWDRTATIGHELQHAREVAEAPDVVDNRTMDALYHRIGFACGVDRHETDAARAVTVQVTQELLPGRAAARNR